MGYENISRAFKSHAAVSAELRRTNAPGWSQATDGLAALTSSGLTTSGNYIAASAGGTDGSAVLPVYGKRRDFRASFKVKATKSTAGSKAVVGFTNSPIGALPTGSAPGSAAVYAAGYLHGSGIVIVRENVSTPVVVVADASLTDGAEYLVSVWVDETLSAAAGSTTGVMGVRVWDGAGAELTRGSSTFTLQYYYANNVIVRTNVAAGSLSDVRISLHPLGSIGAQTANGLPVSVGASPFIRIPATPNGATVFALHGHGSNPADMGWTQTRYQSTWQALERAGFTIVFVGHGSTTWGNDTALASIQHLYNLLADKYDIDPERVYLYGTSMGGGAAATAIAKRLIPVKAAYLAQPACNLEWISQQGAFSTILTAYDSPAHRNDHDPLKQLGAVYAGVPLFITASASDTSVSKTQNADQLVSLVQNSFVRQVAATGNHNDPSHYIPAATVAWFKSFA